MWCEPPKANDLAALLTGLLNRPTTVKELTGLQTRQLAGPATVYVNPDKVPAALSICDFELAAYAGAALAMMPAPVAEGAVRKKMLEDSLAECFGEVVNVLSSKLTKSPNRVVIRLPFSASAVIPDDAKAIRAKPAKRADFDVTIGGYGTGKISLFLT